MADVQPSNGTIRIQNKLYRNALARLTSDEFHVWSCIANYTYGWQCKEAELTQKTISAVTGLNRKRVIDVCRKLEECNVIKCIRKSGKKPTYGLVKDYDSWTCAETRTCAVFLTCADIDTPPVNRAQSGAKKRTCAETRTCAESDTGTCAETRTTPCVKSDTTPLGDTLLHESHVLKPIKTRGPLHPVLLCFEDLSGCSIPETQKAKCKGLVIDLEKLPEWDDDTARVIIKRWNQFKAEGWRKKNPGFDYPTFPYLATIIEAHLKAGTLPSPAEQHTNQRRPCPPGFVIYRDTWDGVEYYVDKDHLSLIQGMCDRNVRKQILTDGPKPWGIPVNVEVEN